MRYKSYDILRQILFEFGDTLILVIIDHCFAALDLIEPALSWQCVLKTTLIVHAGWWKDETLHFLQSSEIFLRLCRIIYSGGFSVLVPDLIISGCDQRSSQTFILHENVAITTTQFSIQSLFDYIFLLFKLLLVLLCPVWTTEPTFP